MTLKPQSEQMLSFCLRGHKDNDRRKALPYPAWLQAIGNDEKTARHTFAVLQAAWMTEAFWTLGEWQPQDDSDAQPSLDTWLMIQRLRGDRFTTAKIDPLADAIETLLERCRYGETTEFPFIHLRDRAHTLHELATEAASREPGRVTPPDIARFMASLAIDPNQCAVYVEDGIGLLHGTGSATRLVGEDLGRSDSPALPASLQDIYETAGTWYRNQAFTNRAFAEMAWHRERDHAPPAARTLLINASHHHTPFADIGQANEHGSDHEGTLNHVLGGPFGRVVVLVSNSTLTSGRQTDSRSVSAGDILRFCAARGLHRVIQLPMGTNGSRHLGHTVLVFDTGRASQQVEFAVIPKDCTRDATRGFGRARRALQLHLPDTLVDGLPVDTARKSVAIESTRRKDRKLISFEANLFLDQDPLSRMRSRFEFASLGTLFDIFRVQHLAPESELFAYECAEIGASDIDEWGHVGPGRLRTTSSDLDGLRHWELLVRDDLLLCFRGSSESFGKVAWIRETPAVMTLPNQSFLVLRPKQRTTGAPAPGLVFWWLRSPWVRSYLEQRAVSTGVSRISPRDVAAIEIPCAPGGLLEKEAQRLMEHEDLLKRLKKIETDMQRIQSDAWTSEESSDDSPDR